MEHQFIETNGIKMHCVDFPGDGPTLILMPGLTANAMSFAGLVHAGLTPRLRVLALDLRGRGQTDKPATGYRMDDHAADVLGLMDQLGLERVVLGGHSFGGLLTYFMAARWPDRVQKCVVLDAPAAIDPTIREQIKPSLERLGVVMPSWEVYLARVKAMPYWPAGWWNDDIEAYYRADLQINADGTVQARSHPENIAEAVEGAVAVNWDDVVVQVPQPVLLLRATQPFGPPGAPPILPRDKADATINRLPDGRLVEIDGNHITFLFGDSAQPTAEAILDFVLAD